MSSDYALVVEPVARRGVVLVGACRDEGLPCEWVRSDDEARAAWLRRGAPAILLVELTNAHVNGFRLLAEFRELSAPSDVPAIVVSAFGAFRDTAWSLRESLNITAVLGSDVPAAGVRLAIRRALGRAGAQLPEPDNRPDPRREQVRLARLRETGLADASSVSERLQNLVEAAASAFGVQAAVCSVLTEDREVVLAQTGLTGSLLRDRGVPRRSSIGRHVVEGSGGEALVIEDAQQHPTLTDNPLVREGLVRGFAGVPVASAGGATLGALCLLDTRPLRLSPEALDALHQLARRAAGELDLVVSHRPRGLADDRAYALRHVHAVLQHLDTPLALWGPDARLRVANEALSKVLTVPIEAILGRDRASFGELVEAVATDAAVARTLGGLGAEPVVAHEDITVRGPPERSFAFSTKPVALPDGTGQLDAWRDVTAERELSRLATTDPLTGLANRRGGEDALVREVARCKRWGLPLSVCVLDIDHFKRVNDTHGHAVGDRVLRDLATIVSRQLRASDLAVRWGGEEFLLVLPGTDLVTARQAAERVRVAVAGHAFAGVGQVTVSIGCAALAGDVDADAAIASADANLYAAKAAGRNRVV